MSRRTIVQLMPSSAVYQQFVGRLVRLVMPRVAVHPRISWMESWMKRASRCGALANNMCSPVPGVRCPRHRRVHAPRIDGLLAGTMQAWFARWIFITGPANGSP